MIWMKMIYIPCLFCWNQGNIWLVFSLLLIKYARSSSKGSQVQIPNASTSSPILKEVITAYFCEVWICVYIYIYACLPWGWLLNAPSELFLNMCAVFWSALTWCTNCLCRGCYSNVQSLWRNRGNRDTSYFVQVSFDLPFFVHVVLKHYWAVNIIYMKVISTTSVQI